MESKTVRVRIGDSDLVFETGKIAKQANGAVYASYEEAPFSPPFAVALLRPRSLIMYP